MKPSQRKILAFTVLLFLTTVKASAQTASDTAALIPTGTVMRGLPYTEPVLPDKPESNRQSPRIAKHELTEEQKTGMRNHTNQIDEISNEPDTILINAYRRSLLTYCFYRKEKCSKCDHI